MTQANPKDHWEAVYTTTRDEADVSWFQDSPVPSLELIEQARPNRDAAIIDIGGGASRLADGLLERASAVSPCWIFPQPRSISRRYGLAGAPAKSSGSSTT